MENLFGKTVIGFDGYTEREGKIIMEESNRWGDFWIVKWSEEGNKESFSKHQIKPISERRGIGVYYA